jgi:hypothetical protein
VADMDYRVWQELFGRTADDPAVKQRLLAAGVTKRLVMPRGELDLLVSIAGMTLNFQDAQLFRTRPPVGEGNCLLTGVTLHLRNYSKGVYDGPLPAGIAPDASQADLRGKFGEPVESDADIGWDQWPAEQGLMLTVQYTDSRQGVDSMLLSLPDPV